MSGHYGPMLRALAANRRDYRVLVFATAVGYTVVVQALAFASLFWRDLASDYGIDPDRVVITQLEPNRENAALPGEVKDAVLGVPGVESFAWMTRRPFRFTEFGEPVAPIDDRANARLAWPSVGDENLLQTFGLPLRAGRNYAPVRAERGADVEAVVSRSLATFLSGKTAPQDAIGVRFLHGIDDRVMRIVGVVDDVSVHTSWVPDVHNILFTYSPLVVAPRHFAVVRVASADPDIIDKLAEAVRGRGYWVEPISLRNMRAFTSATSRGAARVQIVVIAVVLFVGLIGNFGAASFSVRERARTIGIRRALGATRGQIIRYFLEENLLVTTVGLVIGLPIALAVSATAMRLETDFILEWQHLVLAAVFFYCTSLWAAHAPALKAARIPPSVVSQAA